jgi:signal transduction histidine kinase
VKARLFRKHVVLIMALLSGALAISAGIELYAAYQESVASLGRFQREKALNAAVRIEQFVNGIAQQIGWTNETQSGSRAVAPAERRLEYLRLLRQAPAITELSRLDALGHEELRVSRLQLDELGSGRDFSRESKFVQAKAAGTYFSPVYFRKDTEPYMTIAVGGSGPGAAVTVAEVNLKFVWDVVSHIRAGTDGLAYVVDSTGHLIAHPDISLVLRQLDLGTSEQVRMARAGGQDAEPAIVVTNLRGDRMLTAHAEITPLHWLAFVEQPLAEAFKPLYAGLWRTIGLLMLALLIAVATGVVFTRRLVKPILQIQEGATRIGAGELGHRIEVRTGDELESLASEFNRMAERLGDSYAGLEQKVRERTDALREALEYQTATNEVLRAISRSPTELQPILNAVAESAARLTQSSDALIVRLAGESLVVVAHHGSLATLQRDEDIPLARDYVMGRAVLDRTPIHIPDVAALPEDEYAGARMLQARFGYRSVMVLPMLRKDMPIGAIAIRRMNVRPFTEKQIDLLKVFADQAVIAIENVRLFEELRARTAELARSVAELRALGEVGQAVSSTLDLQTVLKTILTRATQLSECYGGVIYEFREATQTFHVMATHRMAPEHLEALQVKPVRLGEGAIGKAGATHAPVQVSDILDESQPVASQVRHILSQLGIRSLLAIPFIREQRLLGGLVVWRESSGPFATDVVNLLQTFAAQSVLAIQNARLFQEIQDKSRELEIANRHKSEFLSAMSHELRTPLNAVIGFSEALQARLFGELNAKQAEYVEDIHASGHHLLSLINDILDLSKIEAGRMELDLSTFDVATAVEQALTFVRDRAERAGVELDVEVSPDLGSCTGDERKFRQILLNLLSNAIKFTPAGGCVGLSASRANGALQVAVSDTGVGIPPAQQETIFEEFRQVGSHRNGMREGTGLGLALARRFVELHGGTIRVQSEAGRGAVFTFVLPGPVALIEPFESRSSSARDGSVGRAACDEGEIAPADTADKSNGSGSPLRQSERKGL